MNYNNSYYSKGRTLQYGTTTACYFATIHLEATKELCRAAGKSFTKMRFHHVHLYSYYFFYTHLVTYGQRALVGIVSMDYQKKSPEFYQAVFEEYEEVHCRKNSINLTIKFSRA